MSTFNAIVTRAISHDGHNGGARSEKMSAIPDLSKVQRLTTESLRRNATAEFIQRLSEAREFLLYYKWCRKIIEEYVGIYVDGVLSIFLFKIEAARPDVDEWIWVVVGDLPPAYLTCDHCPNPATALDGYIGAMSAWVEAALKGESVESLIPVNVPATRENAELLGKRLKFLDDRVLSRYRNDLK